MTQEEFGKTFESRVDSCRRILISKNTEYARGGDKLSNFKKAGGMLGKHPAIALQGMMSKHQISIVDMINDFELGITHPQKQWDEKLNDALNYLFLLDALIKDKC
jgi:hypothetical protein